MASISLMIKLIDFSVNLEFTKYVMAHYVSVGEEAGPDGVIILVILVYFYSSYKNAMLTSLFC